MGNYIVSARKYRPKGFEEVVGQSHITTTLTNAIGNEQIAQAMLFCGPRGVGKTTCARIVARMINGFEESDGNSLNIFELDAASNNSVEDIRNLIEQVRYPPQQGKYKVYIIDEVHMLSQSAFNAFLKTLEEPPAYAVFILATTEKHKVLPTILSRCQIYDFNRIQISDIANHLKKIADTEGITADENALHLIAHKADGALRDALSLFDLIVTFSGGKGVDYATTVDNLHILDHDYYFNLVDHFLEGKHTEALLVFNEIIEKGFDGQHFIGGLAAHLRNLLMSSDPKTVKLMDVPETVREQFLGQSVKASSSWLVNALNLTSNADMQYKTSRNPRLTVELCLVKLSHLNKVLSMAQVEQADAKKKA